MITSGTSTVGDDVVGASVKAWGLLVGLASTGLTVRFVEGAT